MIDHAKTLNPNRSDLQLKHCTFRFNRDIRYRADKRPYKDHFGCELALGGKRSGYPCFYFELRPGASFVGLGTRHVGDPFEHQMRKHAIFHFEQWKKLQKSPTFKNYFGAMLRADPLNPEYSLQEYKSMYGLKKAISEQDLTSKKLSPTWKELRNTSFQKSWEIFRDLPAKEHEYYRQLCFQKDWLWQSAVSDEILLSDAIIDELKKALELAMPMIKFLEEGI